MIQNNRVVKVNRSYWEVVQNGKVKKGVLNNTYKARSMPTVGDYVISQDIDDDKILITDIQKRKNELSKDYDEKNLKFTKLINGGKQIVSANIDKIFIVTSLNKDFNMGKLERFIVLTNLPNAERIIVLSKSDLCDNIDDYIKEINARFQSIKVIVTSGINGSGIDELLKEWKTGETAVFIGSSGVGKSTLVNSLYGSEIAKTNEIRLKDDKGRHTTSASTLFEVVGGRFVIDTPGVREVGLSSVTQETIAEIFEQIELISKKCKRYKCTHTKEEGCAVKAAVEAGEIDKKVLERYIKLNSIRNKSSKSMSDNSKKSFKDKAKSRNKKHYKRDNSLDGEF